MRKETKLTARRASFWSDPAPFHLISGNLLELLYQFAALFLWDVVGFQQVLVPLLIASHNQIVILA